MDVTTSSQISSLFRITGVPSLKFFNGNQFVADYNDNMDIETIISWVLLQMEIIQLKFSQSSWTNYISPSLTKPLRFVYLFNEDNYPKELNQKFEQYKSEGFFAFMAIPSSEVEQFIRLYSIKSLPALFTVDSNLLHHYEEDDDVKFDSFIEIAQTENQKIEIQKEQNYKFLFLISLFILIGFGFIAFKRLKSKYQIKNQNFLKMV